MGKSVWLGLYRGKEDWVMGLLGSGMLAFGVMLLVFATGEREIGAFIGGVFVLLVGLLILIVLFADMLGTPLRIDLSAEGVEMVNWFGRKRFDLASLREVRFERQVQKLSRGRTVAVRQLVWEFDQLGPISIKQGVFKLPWDALFEQLERHEIITFFRNKTQTPIKFNLFGTGSDKPLETYLADETAVSPTTLDEIVTFLQSCKYERDIHQFDKADHWMLPSELEETKRGDCEDHALWAWQKLKNLGIPAEFVTGVYKTHKGEWGGHAWVMLRKDGKLYVFESVDKKGSMLHPWETAKEKYRPGLSIDHEMRTFHYREGD